MEIREKFWQNLHLRKFCLTKILGSLPLRKIKQCFYFWRKSPWYPPGPLLKLINETVLTCSNVLFIFQLCFMSLTQRVDSHLSLLYLYLKLMFLQPSSHFIYTHFKKFYFFKKNLNLYGSYFFIFQCKNKRI